MELDAAGALQGVHALVFTAVGRADTFNLVSATSDSPTAGPADRDLSRQAPRRIVIQYPTPTVDDGRYPVKRCVGDTVRVQADVFRDGHELIRAVVRYRGPDDADWRNQSFERIDAHLGGVRWAGRFEIDRPGRWQYTIEAWTDVFGTWRDELRRKVRGRDRPTTSAASSPRAS